ncbi:PAS domain-containing sensor histidine kinase [Natronorubrum tibetense]|uniref:histidine kinase n=1 Tax=Natronorubrum tibetense GA33 TaxID=1114856 RepID=L9VWH1_9EURY|nr:PAS domain S-box protein [Natronorubrum tibetense]ELY41509.1 HTR-like protein [Natronorubrum tibetense GA33]
MDVCCFVSGDLEAGERIRSLERERREVTITVVDLADGDEWTHAESVDCVLCHDSVDSTAIERIRSEWSAVPLVYVIGNRGDELEGGVIAELDPVDDWVDEDRFVSAPSLVVARLRRAVERATELSTARERATHFSGLIENASDLVTVLDENGVVRYQSPSITDVLGYEQDELVGEYAFDYIHPADTNHAAEVFFEIVRSETSRSGRVVFRFRHADGSWVSLEGVGQSLPTDTTFGSEDDGREFVIISRDITEMRETTEELRSTRDQLQVILDNTPAVVYMKDIDQRYLYVNPAFERLFDRSREEILGKRSEDIHPEVNVEQINEMDREVLSEGESNKYVEDFRINGKRRVFFNVRAPLFDADGEPYAIYGIATEITERQEREESMQALAQAGPRLLECETMESVGSVAVSVAKSVLNQPITGILTPDESGDVLRPLTMTDEAMDLFGETAIPRGSGIAWRVFDTGDLYASSDVSSDPAVLNPETPVESEIIVPLGDHGVLLAGSTEPREFDEHDIEFATILGAMIQGTIDRADRERQLQTKNQRLEDFSNVLAHDLRNPLAVAKGYAELARETGDVAHLTDVEDGIERAMSIMDGLLALARTGQGVSEFESASLERLAGEAWSSIETRDGTLQVETERTITADLGWLQQLFENMFRNAIEHGGSDVSVRVGATDGGFYIADDGPGIDPEQRERLLEGTGSSGDVRFGFKIIRDVVDAHGWELSIGESDEGGARFEIVGLR